MKKHATVLFLILTVLVVFFSGCVGKQNNTREIVTQDQKVSDELANKSLLMIIAPENFRDEELFVTKNVLESRGAKVMVASLRKGIAKGMLGSTIMVNYTIYEINVSDFDAVVFVGGAGATIYFENERALEIARSAYGEGKVVGAICLGPVILARAGILEGKHATVWKGARDELEKAGVIYTGRDVEVDGKIVTASDPKAAEEFALAIIKLLTEKGGR